MELTVKCGKCQKELKVSSFVYKGERMEITLETCSGPECFTEPAPKRQFDRTMNDLFIFDSDMEI